MSPQQQKVFNAVRGGATTPNEIIRATKIGRSRMYTLLYELSKEGAITNIGHGQYAIAGGSPEHRAGRKLGSASQKTLALLSEGQPTSIDAIFAKVGGDRRDLTKSLYRLRAHGYIIGSAANGGYRLAPNGRGNGHAPITPEQEQDAGRSSIPEIRKVQDLCTMLSDAVRALEPMVLSKKKMRILQGLTQGLNSD